MTPSDESGYKVRRGGNPSRESSLRRTANPGEDPLFSIPSDYQLEAPILLNGEEADDSPDGTLARVEKKEKDDGGNYDGGSYDGRSYDGRSYDGSSYDGRSYDGRSYDGRSYDGRSYDGRSYDGSSYDSLVEDFFENAIKNAKRVKKEKQHGGSERNDRSAEGEKSEGEAKNALQRQSENSTVEEKKKDPRKVTIKKKAIQWNSEMLKKKLNKPLMPLLRRKKKSMHLLIKKKKKSHPKMASQANHASEWNSYQNDLDKFKLTKEELEQKRNSLKSKNLDKVKVEYQQRLQRMRAGGNGAAPARKSAPATAQAVRGIKKPTKATTATAANTAITTNLASLPKGGRIKSNEEQTINECNPRGEGSLRCASHQGSRKKDHPKLKQSSTVKTTKRMKERGGHSSSDVNNNHAGGPYNDHLGTPPHMHSSEGKYPSVDLPHSDGFSSGGQCSEWGKHNRRVTQQKGRHLPNGRSKRTQLHKWSALNEPHRSNQFGANQTLRGGYLASSDDYSSLLNGYSSGCEFGRFSSHSVRRKGKSRPQKGPPNWRDNCYADHEGEPPSWEKRNRTHNQFYSHNNHSDSDRVTISTDGSASTGESTLEYFAQELKKRNELLSPIIGSFNIREDPLEDLPPQRRGEFQEKKFYPNLTVRLFAEGGCRPVDASSFRDDSSQDGGSHDGSSPSSGTSSAGTTQLDHLWDSDYTEEIKKLRSAPQVDQDMLRLKRAKLETFNAIKKMVQSVRAFSCEGDLEGATSTREEAPSRGEAPPRRAHRTMERQGDNPLMEPLFRENDHAHAHAPPSPRQLAAYTSDEAEERYEAEECFEEPKSIHSEYNNYMSLEQLHQGEDTPTSTPLSGHKMEETLHQDHLRGDVQLGTHIRGHPDCSNDSLNFHSGDNFATVNLDLRGGSPRLDLTGGGADWEDTNGGSPGDAAVFLPQGGSPRSWGGRQVGRSHRGASVGKATTVTATVTPSVATANMTTAGIAPANVATPEPRGGAKLGRPDPASRAAKKGPLTSQRRDARQSQRAPNKKEGNLCVESISSTSKGSRQGALKAKVHSRVDTGNAGQSTRSGTRREKNAFHETGTLLRGKVTSEAKAAQSAPRRKVSGVRSVSDAREQRAISQKILNTSINFDETQNLSDEDQLIFDSYLNEAGAKREDNLEDIIRNQVALFERDFL
ncbi:conserved Plasmodium protein, unknown function [Plasmodium vivax]|nr:conserved Plasmodium protein, unknown function [Plasmodium vivax]